MSTRRGGRRTAAVAAALAATTLVAACGGAPGGDTKKSAGGKTIVFWHYLTDREALLQKMADQYKAKTGVTVKLTLLAPDVEAQKFQASVQAHTLPDVVAAWKGPGEETAPYAKSGIIANLDQAESSWGDRFPEQEQTAVSFPAGNSFGVTPGKYMVPLDSNNMQFLYNKDLFAKAGIAGPPQTWADLLTDARLLRAQHVTPFVTGLGSWPLDSIATVYQWNILGKDTLTSTFAGDIKYTDPRWVNYLKFFATWKAANLFDTGALANDLPAAENQFVNGKAAMIFDGSWALGVFKQANASFKNYGVFMPPSAPDAGNPVYIPGGVGAELFVVGSSPHRAAALDFVNWLTQPTQQAEYATTSLNLPANTAVPASLLTGIPAIADFASKMTQVQPALVNGMPAPVDTTMQAGLQRLLAGKSTPEAVAAAMQKSAKSGQAQ